MKQRNFVIRSFLLKNMLPTKFSRLFNYRPAPFLLIATVIGIFVSFLVYNNPYYYWSVIVVIAIILLFILIRKKKIKFLLSLCALILFSISFFSTCLMLFDADKGQDEYIDQTLRLRINYVSYDGEIIYADGYINNIKLDGGLSLTFPATFDNNYLKIGDIINAECDIFRYDYTEQMSVYFTDNIRFSAILKDINSIDIGSTSIIEKFRTSITELMYERMPDDEAGLATALVIGDKFGINRDIKLYFSRSGISHILAISGLHIGIIAVIAFRLLKKIKMNHKFRIILISVIILAYAALCGFPPSVVRALLMALIWYFAHFFDRERDFLSSFCIAAIIILAINPIFIVDVGFLMSFTAIFGIVFIAPRIKKWTILSRMPNFISEITAITLSVNIAMLPIFSIYFGEFSIISLISNIFVLPIMSFGYIFLLLSTIITLIMPFMGFLVTISGLFLTYLIFITSVLGTELSIINMKNMGLMAVPYYGGLMLSSQYFFFEGQTKNWLTIIPLIIGIVYLVV